MADELRDLFKNWSPYDNPPSGSEEDERRARRSDPDSNPYETSAETENRTRRTLNEKEVKVLGIWGATDPENPGGPYKQTFVLLRDNRGRKAPIFIGPFETLAIQMALEGPNAERPMTHELLRIFIERLGGKVERVTIDDLWQGTFYSKITVSQGDKTVFDVDARPSDAIAIALRFRAPIYMAENVIEDANKDDDF